MPHAGAINRKCKQSMCDEKRLVHSLWSEHVSLYFTLGSRPEADHTLEIS